MRNIIDIANDIVAREGGYVNDPDDPGGATKYGVTLSTLKRLHRDLNHDGITDLLDLQALDRDEAAEIFVEYYFKEPKLGLLPDILQDSVFDMYVNAGRRAVHLLQTLLCEMGFAVDVDGLIGPHTSRAANRAAQINGPALRDAYGIARRNFYLGLADRRPSSRKYARTRAGGKGGWVRRAESFISAKYHMSDAEFSQRTASWD